MGGEWREQGWGLGWVKGGRGRLFALLNFPYNSLVMLHIHTQAIHVHITMTL